MPFRAKMKRAFGKDSPEDGSDAAQTNGKAKKGKKQKLPDNVYKPGEPMPRPKYRGPWDKEHQDKLTAFNFANAFSRRTSTYSETSPMGTTLPSRRSSFLGFGRKSFARSRQPSCVDPAMAEATEGDDDVANVGLSKQHTREENKRPRTADSTKRPRTSGSAKMDPLQEIPTVTAGNTNGMIHEPNYGRPFTEDELTQAMSRSTLKPTTMCRA